MPPHNNRPIRKPKDTKKVIGNILRYMADYKAHLLIVVVLVILSAAASIAGTFFLKPLINNYVVPFIGSQSPDLSGLISGVSMMAAVYMAGVISTFAYNRIMLYVSTGTLYKIRTDLFVHLQKLPIKYFDTHVHGELMSRFTNDIDAIREMLSQTFVQLISSSLTVTGVFFAMLFLNPVLTVIVIAVLFLQLFVIKVVGGKSGMFFGRQQKAMGEMNGYIEEMIEGQKVVKVFCHEHKAKATFDRLNENLRSAAYGANSFANVLMPIMGNLSYAHYAITAMCGAALSIYTGFDLGSLAAFLQYTRTFSQPITQISQQFNSILHALAGAERIFDVLEQAPEQDNGYVTLVYARYDDNGNLTECDKRTGVWAWKHPHSDGTVTYTQVMGKVTFDRVVFGYEENKIVLNNVSLYANPGHRIAFVGSTGAGKTTITNLINRFYDVPDGKIRYDDININKIKKPDLRRSMSMVLQDTHLFTGTIMDNIRYGKLDATDEEVINAAKLANADGFINKLSNGYNTVITGDGLNLSQGQRQLLAIARAAVADPPVLILDEATSSIDTRTERLIEKGMDSLMKDRTVFVIAHRLSTVRNSNAIMVLENGEIIERGDHDDLIHQKGKYYQLYNGMFELS